MKEINSASAMTTLLIEKQRLPPEGVVLSVVLGRARDVLVDCRLRGSVVGMGVELGADMFCPGPPLQRLPLQQDAVQFDKT